MTWIGMNGLGIFYRRLATHKFPELVASVRSFLPVEEVAAEFKGRNRVFSLVRTFWLFLYQILAGNVSLDALIPIAQVFLWEEEKRLISSNTGGLSQAKSRMPVDYLRRLDSCVLEHFLPTPSFHGYRMKAVDGTGISLPDMPTLREIYPPHPRAGQSSGFPAFKLLGLFDLGSGALLEWSTGSIIASDSELYRLLWPHLEPKDLIIGDRHFCGFAHFAQLQTMQVQSMTRKHQHRKYQKLIKELEKGDRVVEWEKPVAPPKWIEKSDWDKLPNSLRVREITLNMRAKGFRTEKITIVTTILDETIPAKEWAELYFHRWKVEVQFRDIKITMGMDILKAKSPRMIEKEVHMYFIAYNLIRLLMQRAAVENSADLSKMSFKAAARAILVWGPILAKQETDEDFDETLRYFLKTISYPRCRNRKNRTEPRAKKRRPKSYQLLQGDRHHFKEIGHRSKYRKLA